MADYYQVKNQNIFNPPANTSLGNATNQFDDVYIQNDLVLGNTTVTGATIVTPKVSTITYPGDDTAADTAGGQTITLTGSGFLNGASVLINGSAVGVVSVVSSTTITFTSPANATGSYVLYVINTDGGTAIAIPGIQYSGTPTWTTAAGTLGSVYETASFNQSVTATGDAPITYSVASGSIPPGATFNSNGTITGTSQVLSSSTTYTFTVKATDAELQDTNRTFSLTINPDVVTWSSPANGTTYTSNVDSAISNITLSATSAVGSGITYTANALPTGLSLTGANISGTPTVIANSSSLLTATANTTSELSNVTINWVINVANDPYFEYNTLLIPGASTTFVDDASTNNFGVTINGDTKPNNNNPYTPGYYSNYFDGTGDYLSLASNAAFTVGTGNLTIEAWIYCTSLTQLYQGILSGRLQSPSEYPGLGLTIDNGQLIFSIMNAVSSGLRDTVTVPLNQWVHVAGVRSGTNAALFVNGVRKAFSASNSENGTSSAMGLGRYYPESDNYYFSGYISNARLVKGTAVYDPTLSTLTVPTTPLTAIANTSLLTCQSSRFIDTSTNAFTITVNGNTTVNSFDPFVPNSSYSTYGSGYFDGTGDYLSEIGTTSSFNFLHNSTALFTIEAWVYTGSTGSQKTLIGTNNDGASAAIGCWFAVESNSTLRLFITKGSAGNYVIDSSSSGALTLNSWNHVAVTYNQSLSSNNASFYINGVLAGNGTKTANAPSNSNASMALMVGAYLNGGSPMIGYISNLRIVNSIVYASAFTPPTSPLTAISNTSLLTLQNNQSVNNNVFLDNSTNNFFVTRNGNATQGTFSPYGGNWSNYFDGSGDYLSVPDNSALTFGSGDFTISGWLYPTATGQTNNAIILSKVNNIANFAPYSIAIGNGNYNLLFYATSASGSWNLANASSIGTLTPNVWNYFAVCRSGANVYLFLNGQLTTTLTNFGSSVLLSDANSTTTLIGGGNYASSYFTGYISDVRIVKGTAVYTSAFTPPTTPLTAITNTSLLTCADNRLVDDSINNFTITKNGDVSVQRFSPYNPSTLTPTSYSGYFDGTGDSLSLASSTAFGFGTGDFTIELWAYCSFNSAIQEFIDARPSDATTPWVLGITGTGVARTYDGATLRTGGQLTQNAWNHVAWVRASNVNTIYVNGVSGHTWTASQDFGSAKPLTIANNVGPTNEPLTGYISNLRIVKGTAVYASAFTPPTSPLTSISGTSLLTLQSPTFIDNSTNNFTITAFGNSQPTQQNPFGYTSALTEGYTVGTIGGSGYFDGTGDYLTYPSNAGMNFGSGDFTVEAWVYPIVTPGDGSGPFAGASGTTNPLLLGYQAAASGWGFGRNFVAWDYNFNQAPILNTWQHLAVSRSGTTLRLFFNGVLKNTVTTSQGYSMSGGGTQGFNGTTGYLTGYISDSRATNTALYTASFIPPTSPLIAIPSTQLLLNYTSAGVYDSTMMTTMETVGDAKLSTAISKFGESSISFDGTGDYLKIATSPVITLTGSFTIECWLYINSTSSGQPIISFGTSGSASNLLFLYNTSVGLRWYYSSGTVDINQGSTSGWSTGTWYHVAAVRSGSTLTLYRNGISLASGTTSQIYQTGSQLNIGGSPGDAVYLNGYIDDCRITNGYARYTSNFTPPTSAFPIY